MTAAERHGRQLRWRSLSGNLIDRRGAALAPLILLAVGLNVAAVAGLADIAGFQAMPTRDFLPLARPPRSPGSSPPM